MLITYPGVAAISYLGGNWLLVKMHRSSPGCSHGTRVVGVTSRRSRGTRGGGARVVMAPAVLVDGGVD